MDLGGPIPMELQGLTGFEEMLVSRVRPLVQVLTLFPSGQLAYVGHIVNYRQQSTEWVRELPLRPAVVPITLVRRKTREAPGVQRPRAPFVARRGVLKIALMWLFANRPQWQTGFHGDPKLVGSIVNQHPEDGPTVDCPNELNALRERRATNP